jgi:hypothetical protein
VSRPCIKDKGERISREKRSLGRELGGSDLRSAVHFKTAGILIETAEKFQAFLFVPARTAQACLRKDRNSRPVAVATCLSCPFLAELPSFENSRHIEVRSLTVRVAPVSYTIDNDSLRPIINGVQNAIVGYTKAVALGSLQFSSTRGARIYLETNNFGGDTSMNFPWKRLHLFLSGALDLNGISQTMSALLELLNIAGSVGMARFFSAQLPPDPSNPDADSGL